MEVSGKSLVTILHLLLSEMFYLLVMANKYSLDDSEKILNLLQKYCSDKSGVTSDEIKAFSMCYGLRIEGINDFKQRLDCFDVAKEMGISPSKVTQLTHSFIGKIKNSHFCIEFHSMFRAFKYADDGQKLQDVELIQVVTEIVEL